MQARKFIKKFIDITDIPGTPEEIAKASVAKAIEMIETNDDPLDDKFAEALKASSGDQQAMVELVEDNSEYYVLFVSGMMVELEERYNTVQLSDQQQIELNGLLDKLSWMDDWAK
ncbi:MAG: hypothetical protein ACOCXP_00235 [Candidatus Dojkabacteria bacterium]